MNVCSRVVHTCIPYIWFRLIASCVEMRSLFGLWTKQHQSSRAAGWCCMQHGSFWKHTTLHAPRHSIYCMGVKNVGRNTSSTTRNAFLSSIDCEHNWCSGLAMEATWSYHQAGSNWQTWSSFEILLLGILLTSTKIWTSGSPPGRDGQSQKTEL